MINGVQTFLPRMAERGLGGQIVNTASGAGLAATGSGVLYHTSKYGVVGLTEALRAELEPLGIGATVLCPGPVATDIIARTRTLQPGHDGLAAGGRAGVQGGGAREDDDELVCAHGVSPDAVGQMVLSAILENRLYIHTDRVMIGPIEARTRALLEAMPAEGAGQPTQIPGAPG